MPIHLSKTMLADDVAMINQGNCYLFALWPVSAETIWTKDLLLIPLAVTKKYNKPYETFSRIRGDLLYHHKSVDFIFELQPKGTDFFPRITLSLPSTWHKLRLERHGANHFIVAEFSDVHGHEGTIKCDEEFILNFIGIQELLRVERDFSLPRSSVLFIDRSLSRAERSALTAVEIQETPRTNEILVYDETEVRGYISRLGTYRMEHHCYCCIFTGFCDMTEGFFKSKPGKHLATKPGVVLILDENALKQGDVVAHKTFDPRLRVQKHLNHRNIVNVCVAFASLQLPPYVILEIIDWLPWTLTLSRMQKITTIEGVHHASRRVRAARNKPA